MMNEIPDPGAWECTRAKAVPPVMSYGPVYEKEILPNDAVPSHGIREA